MVECEVITCDKYRFCPPQCARCKDGKVSFKIAGIANVLISMDYSVWMRGPSSDLWTAVLNERVYENSTCTIYMAHLSIPSDKFEFASKSS